MPTERDIFAALAGRDFLRCALPRRAGRRSAVRRTAGTGARRPAERGSEPDDVSAFHLRHDGRAEGRSAQRQHPARLRANDGARLAARARRALHAEPAEPQSRARRADYRAGRRRRAGRPRSAARREPARPAGGDRRRVPVRRADPRDRPARRDAGARHAAASPAARLPDLRRGGAARRSSPS